MLVLIAFDRYCNALFTYANTLYIDHCEMGMQLNLTSLAQLLLLHVLNFITFQAMFLAIHKLIICLYNYIVMISLTESCFWLFTT